MKTTAIVAVLASAGSIASAADYFEAIGGIDAHDSVVDLDLVRTSMDGFVQIENMDGEVLATVDVSAGANADLRVPLQGFVASDLTAFLYHDGSTIPAAEADINVDRS